MQMTTDLCLNLYKKEKNTDDTSNVSGIVIDDKSKICSVSRNTIEGKPNVLGVLEHFTADKSIVWAISGIWRTTGQMFLAFLQMLLKTGQLACLAGWLAS